MAKKSRVPKVLILYSIVANDRRSSRETNIVVTHNGLAAFPSTFKKSEIGEWVEEEVIRRFPLKNYFNHSFKWEVVSQALIQECCNCDETAEN